MEKIYSFGSQESLTQNIYLTQGVNETFSTFNCHVSGVQINFTQPDQFVRRMINESCDRPQFNFKESFGVASISKEYQPLTREEEVLAQRYLFHVRANNQQKASLRNTDRTVQSLIEQSEGPNYARKTKSEKKTVSRQILNFINRCFISCVDIKK